MRIFGKGFNFSQDGPGNRLVFHLSGCNMRCRWCSNPEGMTLTAGKEYAVEEIVQECESCRPMFFGGGGVTFTGGEATMQAVELMKALELLQSMGIHTTIETNGTAENLPEIAAHVDYLIMDFKHHDADVLRRYTGAGNETVKRNFEHFCRMGRQMHIRIPLINGFNADDPTAFATFFTQHDTSQVVFEFLPYHEYGRDKWKTPYEITDGFVSQQMVDLFRETFTAYGLKLIAT